MQLSSNKETLRFILGMKIKQLRSKSGLSLKDLAKISNLSSSYINEIEKGKKYPKIEKLISLAQGLKVPFDDLVSIKIGKPLKPILNFLESNLLKDLPFEVFGISNQDLFEIMSQSPEKFSSLLNTVIEIAKSYDLKMRHINLASIRAYEEMKKCYLVDSIKKAKEARANFALDSLTSITTNDLQNILENRLNYKVIEKDFLKAGIKGNPSSLSKIEGALTLFINSNLNPEEKKFVFAKEFGHKILGHKDRTYTGKLKEGESYLQMLNDLEASYFASNLLVDNDSLLPSLQELFAQKSFNGAKLQSIKDSYQVDGELFFNRVLQSLINDFGLEQLFYLKINNVAETSRYKISRELHFSGIHTPHSIMRDEHYCRRWITVSLIEDLKQSGKYQEFGTQISKMSDNGNEYLCLSLAHKNPNSEIVSCHTIGVLIDDLSKNIFKFIENSDMSKKEVSQTCERCPIKDCEQRAAPAEIFELMEERKAKKESIENFIESV